MKRYGIRGELIRQRREALNWSLRELGAELRKRLPRQKFSRQTVFQYEQNIRVPSLAITMTLSTILRIPIEDLIETDQPASREVLTG